MRADEGALVTLNTLVDIPGRNFDSRSAFLVLGGAHGLEACRIKLGDRELVALHGELRPEELLDELRSGLLLDGGRLEDRALLDPFGIDGDLSDSGISTDNSLDVHVDDLLSFAAVGLGDGLLEELNGALVGDDLGELEEGSLHDHVDTTAETDLTCDLCSIDDVELGLLEGEHALHCARELGGDLLGLPGSVEDESSVLLERREHVVLVDVVSEVACDVVSELDEISGLDLLLAETKMACGDTSRLVGIIGKVTLDVHVGVVADDLDGVVVGTDSSIRAKTPEHALGGALRDRVDLTSDREREVSDIILDTDGEVVLVSLPMSRVKLMKV